MSWKTLFDIQPDLTYLNSASLGLVPRESYTIFNDIVSNKARNGLYNFSLEKAKSDWEEWTTIGANFLGANPDEIAFPFNTAGGIGLVLSGLHWEEGDTIIINDLEFPTNIYPYQVLAKKYNLNIKTISADNGRITPDMIAQVMDDSVKLIAISYVQFGNGFRANLGEISKIAHNYGAFTLIDAIQGLGALDFDVKKTNVDFVAAGGYKWLLGPLGTAIFYCRRELQDFVNTPCIGWIADKDFLRMDYHEFAGSPDARRFQSSLMSTMVGLTKSIEILDGIGLSSIEKHIMDVTDYLIQRLLEHEPHIKITSSLFDNERSGIIVFEILEAEKFVEKAKEKNIVISLRNGRIRVSVHIYNDNNDIDKLMIEIEQHLLNISQ